ncbi:hypothetical protein SKAU_G00197570 [Synaphobranchus kaupii]|uniref:Uncharacterized protein n=1 Tax=Synaphobranchus kaupii TaxID=118154 RepID=A0A9Q1IXW6_SYNKA|nr:hypothetical protein SKAU_G00197570 [Synaphobranchus kaupii]
MVLRLWDSTLVKPLCCGNLRVNTVCLLQHSVPITALGHWPRRKIAPYWPANTTSSINIQVQAHTWLASAIRQEHGTWWYGCLLLNCYAV